MGADDSTCPSPRTLERLLAEQLAGPERDSVETHVEICADCQTRLEYMVAPTHRPAAPAAVQRDYSGPEPAEEFLSRLRQLAPPGSRADIAASEAAPGDAAWRVGERIGQYEILGKLGKGGMGTVFKARHTELGKVVALKTLRDERPDEVTLARFKNEIRAVGRLDHPNIVVAHDAGQSDGIHFLVMEYVDGMDLGQLVERRGRLSAADACEVIRQAAVGLQHACEKGLVHRDVKPSNLMLARDGRVRLLDLGLARSFGETPADTLTAQGVMLGTADYLAPEQWDHPHGADTRADIYSLGCTLYHVLTGQPPFPSAVYPSVLNKMQAHVKVPPPPLEQSCPEAPAGLGAVLGRMLAKNPADRFATPAEAAAALRPFTAGCDLGRLLASAEEGLEAARVPAANVVTPAPGAWETDASRDQRAPLAGRGRTWLIVAAGLCLALIAAALFGPRLWRSPELPTPPPPLAIEEFRVNHFRGKQAKPLGDIRHNTQEIRVNDRVRVFTRFGAPAYCYLIAFNPDGSEQLCHPAWDGDRPDEARAVKPTPVTEFRFFPDDRAVFALDASGLQVFVLVASAKPLPPYAEWRSGAGPIPWKPISHGGDSRWQFDGREFTRLPLERGSRAEREAEPPALRGLAEFFRDRPEFEAIQVIAFPVVDEDLTNQWGAQARDFCREGRFVEAQEPIRRQIALLKEKKGENHHETGNATRLLKTLEQVASQSEEARADFAASYRVHDEMGLLVKRGRFPDAAPLAQRVWEIRRRVLGPEHEAAAVAAHAYAQLLYSSSRYAQAEARFREVLAAIRRIVGDNHIAVAKVQGDLAMTLDAQDKHDEAGRLYEASLQLTREVQGEDRADTAISLNNLAGHFNRQARFLDAEPLYRQSLDILLRAEGEDSRRVIIARSNLAHNLGQQAKYSQAEALYRETLRARRNSLGEDHPDTAMNYSNLAANLDDQGRHAEAETLFHKAVAITSQVLGEASTEAAVTLNNLAMNLQHQRKYEEAEPHFRKALEIHRRVAAPLTLPSPPGGEGRVRGESRSVALVHHNLAANLQGQGRLDAAREQIEQALEILGKVLGEEHPDVAQSSIGLASLLNEQKQYAEAEPLVRRGIEIFQKKLGPEHERTVHAHVSLANNLHNQGKYAEAEALLKDALERQRQLMGEGHPNTTWAYQKRVSNLWAQGKYREIDALGPAAAASFEAARPRFSSAGLDRAGRTLELSPLLTYLAAAAAGNGHPAAAWQYVESRLARGLLDDLSAHPLTDAERDAERALLKQIDRLDQRIAALTGRQEVTVKDRREADNLRATRDAAQAQLAGLRAELTVKYGVAAGKVYDLRRIQERLPRDAALVAWVDLAGDPKFRDPEGAHWVCAVRHRGDPVWVRLPGGAAGAWQTEDEELPAKVRGILADRGDVSKGVWKDLVRRLYAQRLAPLEGHLGSHDGLPAVRHLIVLPSNVMAGIPVEALTDRFTISYAPSATTYAWLQERRGEAAGRTAGTGRGLLAVGDPIFGRPGSNSAKSDAPGQRGVSFDRLPATAKEIQAVARVFWRPKLLKESEASEQNLERMAAADELRKFRFLHFATHGLLDDRRALNSALILAQDQLPDPLAQVLDGKGLSDGRLTAGEILRGWKLDADLVTLSACETALGKFSGGEGHLGFSQALFLAGARGMVLSLWRVDDRATALLMTRFYENMLGTPEGGVTLLPKAQALAEAKQWLRALSAVEVDRLTADLPKGLPAGTRGVRREVPAEAAAADAPRPFEHPYYWSAFILIGDPW